MCCALISLLTAVHKLDLRDEATVLHIQMFLACRPAQRMGAEEVTR